MLRHKKDESGCYDYPLPYEAEAGYAIVEMIPADRHRRRRLPFARIEAHHVPRDWHCIDPSTRRFLGFFETIRFLIEIDGYRAAWSFVLDYFIASRRIMPDVDKERAEIEQAIDEYNASLTDLK